MPPELRDGPSNSTPCNLAILLLSCDILRHDAVVLIGRFVSESSMAYLRSPGRGLSFREQKLFGDVFTRHCRRTFEAWERFRLALAMDAPIPVKKQEVSEAREALSFELTESIAAFAELPASVMRPGCAIE
ncbi:hypothetical protein [Umezawaea sp. NPDC059074]|uniref:hypothetical protein n=1 Tax=Umezawaea sp. NPDC059074 TaxID=3346716 RepID=UPI003677EC09